MTFPAMIAMWANGGAYPPLRPVSMTNTFAPTNPTYAYNGTAAAVDYSTASTYTTNSATNTMVYSFAAGTGNGTLRIGLSSIITQDVLSLDDINEAISSVTIAVSTDGTTYGGYIFNDSGATLDQTNGLVTYALPTNQNMANFKVKIVAKGVNIGSGSSQAIASVTCNISDIVVY